jgi:hypothetical protein
MLPPPPGNKLLQLHVCQVRDGVFSVTVRRDREHQTTAEMNRDAAFATVKKALGY